MFRCRGRVAPDAPLAAFTELAQLLPVARESGDSAAAARARPGGRVRAAATRARRRRARPAPHLRRRRGKAAVADLLTTPSENAARQRWALPDAWDTHAPSTTALPRSEVSIVAVSHGSGWQMAGTAAPQTVYGPGFTGGGRQVLISGVRSDAVLWTGPAP